MEKQEAKKIAEQEIKEDVPIWATVFFEIRGVEGLLSENIWENTKCRVSVEVVKAAIICGLRQYLMTDMLFFRALRIFRVPSVIKDIAASGVIKVVAKTHTERLRVRAASAVGF